MDISTELEKQGSKEVKKKPNPVDPSIQCMFSRKVCKRKRLRGFDFCHKHILEDKNSPFQQCSFIIKSTEERCVNPAPKADNKKTFCLIHTRDPKLKKAHDEIMRRNLKRKLDQRKSVSEAKRVATQSTSSGAENFDAESKHSRVQPSDLFSGPEMREIDGIYALQDNGKARFDVAWFGENDSDAESVDSEEEDPLRHAGVWTLEEALRMCRDKMIRKRSLYLEQYKRLHILLRERRKRYLTRVATSAYQSEASNDVDNPLDTKLVPSEQKALRLYQHMNGTELLLERQAKEKRSRSASVSKPVTQNRCHHEADSERCEKKILPFSKFCLQHICCDPDQRLYRGCSYQATSSNSSCTSPVPLMLRYTTCELHAAILPRFCSETLNNIINPAFASQSETKEEENKPNEEESEDTNKTDNGKTESEDTQQQGEGSSNVSGDVSDLPNATNSSEKAKTTNEKDVETPMDIESSEGVKGASESTGSAESSSVCDKRADSPADIQKKDVQDSLGNIANGISEDRQGKGSSEHGNRGRTPVGELAVDDSTKANRSEESQQVLKDGLNLPDGGGKAEEAGQGTNQTEAREVYSDSPKSGALDTSTAKKEP